MSRINEDSKDGRRMIRVIGGNQNDGVSEKLFPASRLLGFRCPPKVEGGAAA